MYSEQVTLGRIMAIIGMSEEIINNSHNQTEKFNAMLTAYEQIVKIIKEFEK